MVILLDLGFNLTYLFFPYCQCLLGYKGVTPEPIHRNMHQCPRARPSLISHVQLCLITGLEERGGGVMRRGSAPRHYIHANIWSTGSGIIPNVTFRNVLKPFPRLSRSIHLSSPVSISFCLPPDMHHWQWYTT